VERGKILQYSQNDGCGCVLSNNNQFAFTIRDWRGESAPALNRIVNVEFREGALVSVAEVPESVLLQEKAAEAGEVAKKTWR